MRRNKGICRRHPAKGDAQGGRRRNCLYLEAGRFGVVHRTVPEDGLQGDAGPIQGDSHQPDAGQPGTAAIDQLHHPHLRSVLITRCSCNGKTGDRPRFYGLSPNSTVFGLPKTVVCPPVFLCCLTTCPGNRGYLRYKLINGMSVSTLFVPHPNYSTTEYCNPRVFLRMYFGGHLL